ncbi:hypothetical protein [Plantactinospora soyae]|uniref:Uncharacterized protein n=1 Tax=Plantactinospora soyae TaxID=1544732 RepID=A0A927LZZ5_9ACTN|nr:hypothetical protein [Plantactinospora soyae]MBE1485617.1 hypothetical protein [Plantactinospora soyae]
MSKIVLRRDKSLRLLGQSIQIAHAIEAARADSAEGAVGKALVSHLNRVGNDLTALEAQLMSIEPSTAESRFAFGAAVRLGQTIGLELAKLELELQHIDIGAPKFTLSQAEEYARELVGTLNLIHEQKATSGLRWPKAKANTDIWRPNRAAVQILAGLTRILPETNRPRYAEEFRSELWELARSGATCTQQLMYAIRLFDRAWQLRAELRDASIRRARS